MAFKTKIQPYRVVELSWVSPPVVPIPPIIQGPPIDAPIGLDAYGLANTFTLMEGPDDVAFRLNNKSEDLLEGIEGADGITISEIYITSAEPEDTVKLYVAWEVQWE